MNAIFLLIVAEVPAALLDPAGAARWARDCADPLMAAETALVAGDARGALDRLDALPADDPRRLRLELDALSVQGDHRRAAAAADALAKHPGWAAHAAQPRPTTTRSPWWSRIGATLFALAAAVLALGGGRELVRIRAESLILATAVLVALLLINRPAGGPLGLVFVGCLALGHAAIATVHRSLPGTRGRLLISVVAVMGVGGVAMGALSHLAG